jgi:ANTAR domain
MRADGSSGPGSGPDDVVVRKADHGWVVGRENVSDLTSAIVLADLFAADHATGDGTRRGAAGAQTAPVLRNTAVRDNGKEVDEAARLAVTVTQLEHALASRVGVEQAIGVLAERHRLRPREAFDLLRGAARAQGRRVTEIAQDVVASTANPLLRLPEELARKLPEPRPRQRSLRRARRADQF